MFNDKIIKFMGSENLTIVEVMQKIDDNSHGILYIVNEHRKLLGCATDGDIRRWIIRTGDIKRQISDVMNRTPRYAYLDDDDESIIRQKFEKYKVKSIPILNAGNEVVDIFFEFSSKQATLQCNKELKEIPVIIMAGGKGTRLYPYTKILPKPLIPIGEIPILERILNKFYMYGVSKFFITVNYKKEMIKSYFQELKPPYLIEYVEEDKPLGTAGSIKLIREVFDTPIIISNCDILIEAEYNKILSYHKESRNDLTIVSSLKNTVIPYGVLHAQENGIVTSMEEKPCISHFINTGMYIVNPEYIREIPDDTFYHMTDLANKFIEENRKVGMYPISENSYLDMGQLEEMKKMEERISADSSILVEESGDLWKK